MICVPFVICHPYINNKSNFKYRHLNLHLEVKYLVKYGTEIKVVLTVCSVKKKKSNLFRNHISYKADNQTATH